MNIWKISSRPGPSESGKWIENLSEAAASKKYIEYALSEKFVALGFGWIGNLAGYKNDYELEVSLRKYPTKKLSNRAVSVYLKQIKYFKEVISKGDIVLMYHKGFVYVGRVLKEKPYNYVGTESPDNIKGFVGYNNFPHRIKVEWLVYQGKNIGWQGYKDINRLLNEGKYSAKLEWNDTLHLIDAKKDLGLIKDKDLRGFLEEQIGNKRTSSVDAAKKRENEKRVNQIKEKKLDESQQVFEDKYKEGAEKRFVQVFKERSPKLRKAAINKYGRNCMVCGFNFDKYYGKDLAKGYIEVHHLKPLSQAKEEGETSLSDVIVICSNCHRIIHSEGSKVLDWKEMKKQIQANKSRLRP